MKYRRMASLDHASGLTIYAIEKFESDRWTYVNDSTTCNAEISKRMWEHMIKNGGTVHEVTVLDEAEVP